MMEPRTYSLPRSHNGDIVSICFNSTGDYLASCALDGTATIYAILTRQLTHFLEFNETPSCLTWIKSRRGLPGPLAVVVGSATGSLRLASFCQGNSAISYEYLAHSNDGAVTAITQRGQLLAAAIGSKVGVWIYDVSRNMWIALHDITAAYNGSPGPVTVKQLIQLDDRRAAALLANNVILLVDLISGKPEAAIRATATISGMAAVGHGIMLSVSPNCRLVWLKEQRRATIYRCQIMDAHLSSVVNAPVLLAESKKGDICIWNYISGRVLVAWDRRDIGSKSLNPLAAVWNANCGGFILAGVMRHDHTGLQSVTRIHHIVRTGPDDSNFLSYPLHHRIFSVARPPKQRKKPSLRRSGGKYRGT